MAQAGDWGCAVAGDKIIIRFPKMEPQIKNFAIIDSGDFPHGNWQTVVDVNSVWPRLSPYQPTMKRLVIDTRRQLARRFRPGSGITDIVHAFVERPRTYTLIFSDDLGTEPENMTSWECTVRIGR